MVLYQLNQNKENPQLIHKHKKVIQFWFKKMNEEPSPMDEGVESFWGAAMFCKKKINNITYLNTREVKIKFKRELSKASVYDEGEKKS